jgi:hypothetical protein
MLTQHEFYVYHDENRVYARRREEEAVLARTLDTPQDAHDLVQSIVNPDGLHCKHKSLGEKGFHHPSFQEAISENCREFVEAAYANA